MFRNSSNRVFRTGMLLCMAGMASGVSPVSAQLPDWIVNDFEMGTLSTPMNGYFYFFDDRLTATAIDTVMGNSTITSLTEGKSPFYDTVTFEPDARTFPPGRSDSSKRALKFGYALGDRPLSCGASCTYAPYVGFGLGFSTMTSSLDFSTSGGIAFWAKAETDSVVFSVSIGAEDTTVGAPDYAQRFVATTTWKRYVVNLVASAVFKQPDWGPRKPFNAAMVKTMNFGINKGDNALAPTNALLIDDLVVVSWEYVDPTGVRRQVAGRAASRVDFTRRNGKVRFLAPERLGKGLVVDAAGRLSIPMD